MAELVTDLDLIAVALISLVGGLGLGALLGIWAGARRRQRWQQEQETLNQQLELQRQQNAEQQLELARLQERQSRLPALERALEERDDEIQALQSANTALQAELRAAQTRLEESRSHHQEQLALLARAREQMQVEFKQLAQGIFEDNSRRFGSQQQEKLDHVLKPLREQLGEFRRRVDDVYDREAKDRRGLQEQVEQLKQLNLRMSQDALNLTNALKGENKAQGNWGEVVLERILEQSGLRKGHEYQFQVSARGGEGQRYQPDVVVHLPEQKDVIIDAKVTLIAYERYVNAEDEAQAATALREHLQAVRRHIKGLSEKSYQQLEGVRTLDFVLLFMPVEAAFMVALEQDASLFSDAFAKNILLVSPSTLLVTLKTINHIWRHEQQNRNAQEIARQGGELYDKFVGFVEALEEVGRYLELSQRAYSTAHKRLSSGRGNLVSRVQSLTELGVRGKKSLPESLLDTAGEAVPAQARVEVSK